MIMVPAEHLDINRQGINGRADYTDIVQVALLQTVVGTTHPLASVNQANVGAIDRLGMHESLEEIDMSGGVAEVDEIREAII
jgi:hypothetical protein